MKINPPARRTPVPAGGAPTPAVIAAADATPPASAPAADGDDDDDDEASAHPLDANAGGEAETTEDDVDEADTLGEDDIVDARVLIAFDDHQVNDVISDTVRNIGRLKLAGQVDPHPDAVAFARTA